MTERVEPFESWDPLDGSANVDPGILIGAQRREIGNILKSYTGYYDVFSELLQNALDAVEKRMSISAAQEPGKVWIEIDLREQSVRVSDNGCGMDLDQIRQFLRPNFSFKSGPLTRGSKGVGATYLGYGFNSLHIASRMNGITYSGVIENGRNWVEDNTQTVSRPRIVSCPAPVGVFSEISQGTSIKITLKGSNIRPRSLGWNQATTAEQWLSLLRVMTPVGGIYIKTPMSHAISVSLKVIKQDGSETISEISTVEYLYPHKVINRSGSMSEFLKDQRRKMEMGIDPGKIAPRFKSLNGLWGEWSVAELLGDVDSDCPINLTLDNDEKELARSAGVSIYIYLAFSTDLWDFLNDNTLKLRKGSRVLHGGLQLATKNMPQGMTLTIPMTNNIGFQNLVY